MSNEIQAEIERIRASYRQMAVGVQRREIERRMATTTDSASPAQKETARRAGRPDDSF